MRKCYQRVLLAFFFSFVSITLVAQVEKLVRFSNGDFKADNNIIKQSFKEEDLQPSRYGEKYFVLIQFSSLPSIKQQQQLKATGIDLDTYLPGDAYLASIKRGFDFTSAKNFNIISINVVPAEYKIAPALQNFQKSYDKLSARYIAVSYHSSMDKETVEEELQKAGATIVPTKFNPPDIIFIQANPTVVDAIAALPFVSYISLQTMKDEPLNYNDRATHSISGLNALGGKNLNGAGVTIGVGDNADISTHIDFAGRLIIRIPWYPDVHGTHVAGTAGGAGIIDIKNRGLASKATIVNQLYSDIITNVATFITDNNLVLTNNSYYSVDAGCPGEGEYDVLSNYVDWQIKNYDQLLHVIAAGNDGGLTCSPYPTNYGTVKSGWQSAKNVLTVGAMETQDYSIPSFDSRGPVQDGRIKPEISAGGYNVLSTYDYNGYGLGSGTSMACPVAVGSLTLMYERYRQLHGGANPKSALMKSILCNTAEDLGNAGPDYSYGFGMINARRAVQAIDSNWYYIDSITNGANASRTFVLTKNARMLKVMLYWADKEAAIDAATTLVNDLDLTVTTPAAVVHYPLVLNPAPAHVNDTAVEGADHINNIEQVTIQNPVAGTYNINVSGFSIPFGPQDYAVTYEVLDSSVVVEYPFGGETWVAGETENIRWSAYGSENNSFTIQYSTDNGNTWTLINNNVPSTSRLYAWVVPSTVTNQALIRITRNGTNLQGQSNFDFIILGRPVVVDTNVCQGYVQLNWGTIAGATSYDILELTGDSMRVIANTTDTFFLVKGLNKDINYWFGVQAKNGAVAGRRSISVNVTPNGGACTLLIFNNDLIVDSILQPNTARQYFSNATNATQPVMIRIKNLGGVPVTGPFNVSYNYEGGTATEVVNATIPSYGTYNYTFTTPYTIDSSGFHYKFKAWVTDIADTNHQNDTAYKWDNLLANAPITSLPVTEGFETTDSSQYMSSVLGLRGNDAFDFSANTADGRVRSFVNTGFAHTGIKAMTLDQYPYATFNTSDSLTANYNLSHYLSSQLRYDFYYKNQGQSNLPGNKLWIRGSENDTWVQAYDLYANQATGLGMWTHGNFNVNDVLNSATPPQTISSTFQIRFGEEGSVSANTPYPLEQEDNGYTFDDLTMNEVFNDIALTQIISPDKGGCGLSAHNPVTVQIKNYSDTVINNFQVNIQLNNGNIITDTVPSIAANATLNYTFNETIDLSNYINYTINAWVKYVGDTYPINDSILGYTLHSSPIINSFPYLQGFESDSGNFYAGGLNSSWQWGTPSKPVIYKAANGKKAWVTNLTGNYNDNENSYLYSPCFDISSLVHPMLSFSHIYQVEQDFDYTWVEYSNDGINWQKLGAYGSGTNWYDDSASQSWNISDTRWHVASIDIPTTGNIVHFRWAMSSDAGVTYDGVGIDDVHIFDKAAIYTGTSLTGITQNVSGNNWIDFTDTAGNKIVSINPAGMDLGTTTVQVYAYTGKVRVYDNKYFLNRNLVITPTNPPTSNVGIRFYFTDVEADSLIGATGCSSCLAPPSDAYVLNITKYSGSSPSENGTLNDDSSGFFQYFAPDSNGIVPYNNGYYTEFAISTFSEFWLDSGMVKGSQPLALDMIYFNASKQDNTALLQWSTQNQSNTAAFIIERSSDGINFSPIGTVSATTQNDTNIYGFTDTRPLAGLNFYRLKIVSTYNNTFQYSAIRKLNFDNSGDDFTIYPNPVTNGTILIASSGNATGATLTDAAGKKVKSFVLQGENNLLNLYGLAKGVYELKVFTATTTYTDKILIQ